MAVEENAWASPPETDFKHIGNSRLQNKALSMSVLLELGDASRSCDHKLFRYLVVKISSPPHCFASGGSETTLISSL